LIEWPILEAGWERRCSFRVGEASPIPTSWGAWGAQ